jgi:hypothetical protein
MNIHGIPGEICENPMIENIKAGILTQIFTY